MPKKNLKIVNDTKPVKMKLVKARSPGKVDFIARQLAELTPEGREEVIRASGYVLWNLARWAVNAFADSVADRVVSKIERKKGW